MSKLAVVFGGSGFVGRHVVRELAKRGWRVRVAVRRPHLAQFLRPLGAVGQIHLAQANIRYRDSVLNALDGADAVVNLVGILAKQGPQTFEAVQTDGARIIAELTSEAGIENIVHISAIGADKNSPSHYARTKALGEEAMRKAHPQAVIVRPSVIFGPEDDFFNRFGEMMALFRSVPLIGGGKTRFQPVYVDDVADAICAALENPGHRGKTFELGGPQVANFKELMALTARIIDRKVLMLPLPFPIAGMMGATGDLVAALSFGLVPAPITADQVRLLKADNVVSEDAIGFEALGITPDTMEAILPTYLYRFRKYGRFTEVRPS